MATPENPEMNFPQSMPVTPATPMDAIYRAVMANADPGTVEKLMALQERFERNQGRKAFDKAIAAAKAEIPPIIKNRMVSHGVGKAAWKFADLAEIDRTITPILSKHGLSYRYRTDSGIKTGDLIKVTCIISHQDGYCEENSLSGPADTSGAKNALQAIGSAVSYLQRYSLNAALGLSAAEDNDGDAGGWDGKLTEVQIEALQVALVQTSSDLARFCQIYNLDKVEDLPPSLFDAAMRMLAEKRKVQQS